MIRDTLTQFTQLTLLPLVESDFNFVETWQQSSNCVWVGKHMDQLNVLQTPLDFPTCIVQKRDRTDLISFITYYSDDPTYIGVFNSLFSKYGKIVWVVTKT